MLNYPAAKVSFSHILALQSNCSTVTCKLSLRQTYIRSHQSKYLARGVQKNRRNMSKAEEFKYMAGLTEQVKLLTMGLGIYENWVKRLRLTVSCTSDSSNPSTMDAVVITKGDCSGKSLAQQPSTAPLSATYGLSSSGAAKCTKPLRMIRVPDPRLRTSPAS